MCSEILNEQNNSCFDKDATLVIKQEAIINNVKYIKDKIYILSFFIIYKSSDILSAPFARVPCANGACFLLLIFMHFFK